MRWEFRLWDVRGWVDVSVEPNTTPERLGCPPYARGFPVCTATVTYPEKGYKSALGWVQLVRSSGGPGAGEPFELDPFEPLGRTPHPFCFFGFAPMLFDAPSRPSLEELHWTAESFLCFIAPSPDRREARATLGFSWGFDIQEETISLKRAKRLAPDGWTKHLLLLRREHPAWDFAAGFRDA